MDEEIPIDITRPENFLNREFYLMIARPDIFDNIYRDNSRGSCWRRLKLPLRNLVEQYTGRSTHDPRTYDGALIEVVERKPHAVKGYKWPEFNRAILSDGTRANTHIEKVFDSFIFIPTSAHINGGPYMLEGNMRPYKMHTNEVGDLEKQVRLEFDEVPSKKFSNGSLACL